MSKTVNGNVAMGPPSDKTKDWQLEILMEKIRSKATQYKSLAEISKNVRMTMLDKRYALDSVEKAQHQKCLDTLQHSIKVTSLQSMIERLESLTRQLGLKFMVGPRGVELFISSDMFYLEIVLNQNGDVKDVKVHHESKVEQQSCAELVSCLSRGDFADFTAQLEGFASIYQLNAEKKTKCKAFTALQSLESDLSTLAQLQSFMKEPFNLLHKSPVGILEKRRGGHPMKLTYFVSPYDLLNVEKGEIEAITIENIVSKNLGYSVTVCIEGSGTHKLQTTTLITVSRNLNGKSTPSFSSLSGQNSAAILACFLLKLNKPMPMCTSLVRQIQQLTELDSIEQSPSRPLLSLIVNHFSEGKMESTNNRGLFVTLPDQTHCYFMTESKTMEGVLINSIPFTHPAHVSQILLILRKQALFNTIISSCVRPNSRQDFENMTMFEISALSLSQLSIALEHPVEECMATAEIDLNDISNLICKIRSPGTPPPPNTPDSVSELCSRILNRTFSIPVTMRSLIKLWEKQQIRRSTNTNYNGHENFSLPLGSGDPGGHKGTPGSNNNHNQTNNNLTEFGGLDKIKQEPSQHHQQFLNDQICFQSYQNESAMLTNMELTQILTGGVTDCLTTNNNITTSITTIPQQQQQQQQLKKKKWINNKRKLDDCDLLLESSSSDSTSRSTPISQETEITTPNSGLGFQSDLELSGLDPTELLGGDKGALEFDNIDELGDVEEMLAAGPSRNRREKSSLNLDLETSRSLVPPSVSITPIPNSPNYQTNSEKRPGIEIIPLATTTLTTTSNAAAATTPTTNLPSSITITPISTSDKKLEKKKNKTDEKNRLERKRKRKRDESPMGPPDKLPPTKTSDPLAKPVTVSIKPTESPPTSPNMMRKFNASPTQNRVSPILKPIKHHSPKHSPAHLPNSSPKPIVGISSPKSHGTSPKHPSTSSGSGKPSMSTLKSAANSPSSKSQEKKSSTLSSQRENKDKDKEKKALLSSTNNKNKQIKVKQLDLNTEIIGQDLPSPSSSSSSSSDPTKYSPNQVRNRKGSLSAIVDKLKSAQCDNPTDLSNKREKQQILTSNLITPTTGTTATPSSTTTSTTTITKLEPTKKLEQNKNNSEYMVKSSSDGIKITINKTRTKDKLISNKSSSGSPKTHTGLKPGVNSGPASKKPQQQQQQQQQQQAQQQKLTNFNTTIKKISSSSSSSKILPTKLATKLGSPKSSDLRNKDRPKLNKSTSDKSIFTKERRGSPTQNEDVYKLTNYAPLEGIMKQWDKTYQIPKLSARVNVVNDEKRKQDLNNVNAKIIYPLALTTTATTTTSITTTTTTTSAAATTTPLTPTKNNLSPQISPKLEEDKSVSKSFPSAVTTTTTTTTSKTTTTTTTTTTGTGTTGTIMPTAPVLTATVTAVAASSETLDLSSKFLAPAPLPHPVITKDQQNQDKKENNKKPDELLDFSDKYPQSPSVSVQLVKSPAVSPIVHPSPHSASPCITDDELMDEALIGLGK